MSGHSKWSTIKFKKAATDAKRGQMFSKLIKEITVAVRLGGSDPESNPRLRTAISKAKEINMPNDNIDRAVKRGSGDLPGVSYEEQLYEGYGQGGVAIIVETLSDNKNRAASEIRTIFSKGGGNMAGAGSVSWMFKKKGFISVLKAAAKEDELFMMVTEAGAEDFKSEEDAYEIICEQANFEAVKKVLTDNKISWEMAEITYIPQNTISLKGKEAQQVLKLLEALEEHDDVQNVASNADIPESEMEMRNE